MFPCLFKHMIVILFFEVILFNLEASAQKFIKPPGIWRRVIMVHHQIKFLSQHTEHEKNTFLDIALSFSKTPKKHNLHKIKSKYTFNCDLFCCQIMNLCKATFEITISYFNGKRNSFFRDFSVRQRVKHFVCHVVAGLWSLKKSPVLLGFRHWKFGHNLPKRALEAEFGLRLTPKIGNQLQLSTWEASALAS